MHPVVISILVVTCCYCTYYFLFYKNYIFERWVGNDPTRFSQVILMRLGGFFIFLVPYLFAAENLMLISPQISFIQLAALVLGLGLLLVIINFFAAKSPENLAMYPQIRKSNWKLSDILVSAATWIMYLIGYEYLFRGYLFYSSLQYFDPLSATGLNVAIYMLVHIPKGYKETFGAAPMGAGLCAITYFSGNVFPAIVLHSILALSNEWFSIYYQSRQSKTI